MPVDILDTEKVDVVKSYIREFILWPDMWKAFSLNLSGFKWQQVKLRRKDKSTIPTVTGVYSFVIQPQVAKHPCCSYLMYIGQTTDQDLRKRFEQYIDELEGKRQSRPKVKYLLDKFKEHLFFVFLPLDNKLSPKDVESELIKAFLPPVNDVDTFPVEVKQVVKAALG
jgi:hypothetical protein